MSNRKTLGYEIKMLYAQLARHSANIEHFRVRWRETRMEQIMLQERIRLMEKALDKL